MALMAALEHQLLIAIFFAALTGFGCGDQAIRPGSPRSCPASVMHSGEKKRIISVLFHEEHCERGTTRIYPPVALLQSRGRFKKVGNGMAFFHMD